MPTCSKCEVKYSNTKKQKEHEKLVKILNSEILMGKLIEKMFNKIGQTVMNLADFNRFMSSFRFSKEDSKKVLSVLIDNGVIQKQGGARKPTELRMVNNKGKEAQDDEM